MANMLTYSEVDFLASFFRREFSDFIERNPPKGLGLLTLGVYVSTDSFVSFSYSKWFNEDRPVIWFRFYRGQAAQSVCPSQEYRLLRMPNSDYLVYPTVLQAGGGFFLESSRACRSSF